MFKRLIEWSKTNYSHLPWRKKRSLYRTLVSEIMLQQTTVGTVVQHFERFLLTYPTLADLAASSEEEVTRAWQGLGYYRRARNLRKAAIVLQQEHGGHFPEGLKTLCQIPGIGQYTAAALWAIGMNRKALAIDANVERVLARFFCLRAEKGPHLQKMLIQLFEEGEILADMEKWGPRQLHEALMDVGRHFCKAKSVDCPSCPLRQSCRGSKLADPLAIPFISVKEKTQSSTPADLTLLRVVVRRGKNLLGYVKGEHQWLSGQVEVPSLVLSCDDSHFKQYPLYRGKELPVLNDLPQIKTGITKYRIHNFIWETSKKEFQTLAPPYCQGVPLFQLERRTPLCQCHCKNFEVSFFSSKRGLLTSLNICRGPLFPNRPRRLD